MTDRRGKVHKYLGMTLDYKVRGQVEISMFEYVDEILAPFDRAEPRSGGTNTSAAPEDLFKVDDDCATLGTDKSAEFYNIVAKNYQTRET
jgi:hypothetical protein